jgi:hypothetical protein
MAQLLRSFEWTDPKQMPGLVRSRINLHTMNECDRLEGATLSTSSADSGIAILLIHGTWRQGFFPRKCFPGSRRTTKWFDDGSTFRERLEGDLIARGIKFEIKTFLWSGCNSVVARKSAADTLTNILTENDKSNHIGQVIIAHSHGGNIAIQAMQGLEEVTKPVSLIAMATPFITFNRNRDPRLISVLRWNLIALGIPMAVLAMMAARISANEFRPGWASLVAALAGFALVRWVWMTFVKSIVKIRRSERFTSRKPIRHGRASIFVIRAPDDEADIALKLGNWGAKLMQKTLRASLIVFQLGIITITMCLLLLIAYPIWGLVTSPMLLIRLMYLIFRVFAATLAGIISLVASGLLKSVNGADLAFGTFRVDVNIETVPLMACFASRLSILVRGKRLDCGIPSIH